MLITCPSCAATYDLPTDRIGGAGRKVRCVSCRESWFVASPEIEAASATPKPSLDDDLAIEIVARAVPLPPSRAELAATDGTGRGKGRGKGRGAGESRFSIMRAAKVSALLLVFVVPPIIYAGRDAIVSAAPGTASLYRSLGVPVNLAGLGFAKVSSHLSDENGASVLQVTGEVVNEGKLPRTVPWLHIALQGEQGEALYSWSAKAAEGELQVGQSAPFRVRLTAPPAGAQHVVVSFRDKNTRRAVALD